MSFYISTHGKLHPHTFPYLNGIETNVRLEPTLIHLENQKVAPKKVIKTEPQNKTLFAINIMTKEIITKSTNSHLYDIQKIMTNDKIRHVPIIDAHQKLIGIVSDRDLLKIEFAVKSSVLEAQNIMSTVIVVSDEESSLKELAYVMTRERISAIPVIDKNECLVGIITTSDLLKTLFQ